ncbi:MAG: hypothetical protein II971_07870 [Firmicutes bacterium]|nr:hypothetical protein [Bacillota bacterium]
MKELIIKNGTLLDKACGLLYEKKDIRISGGLIAETGTDLSADGCELLDASGMIVSPGFIDVHVHNNLKPQFGHENEAPALDSIDELGVYRGASTVIEAGSWCIDDFDEFLEKSGAANSRYYTLLSAHGEDGFGSLGSQDIDRIIPEHYYELCERYPELIRGLKLACSNTMTGDKGYGLCRHAKMIASHLGLPLTVHIGSFPPDPLGIIEFLDEGDVVTHTYHGKQISLFKEDGTPKEGVLRARDRGVLFDVGHGSASYSYPVAEKAFKKGFLPDLIGTDIRALNIGGPVYSLSAVASKVMCMGVPLEDVVYKITGAAASAYGLEGLGSLRPGCTADIELFEIVGCALKLPDCAGELQPVDRMIVPKTVIVSKGGESRAFGACLVSHPQ